MTAPRQDKIGSDTEFKSSSWPSFVVVAERELEIVTRASDDRFGHFVEREEFADAAVRHSASAVSFPFLPSPFVRARYTCATRFLSITSVGNFPLAEMH